MCNRGIRILHERSREPIDARVIGREETTDLALLEVAGEYPSIPCAMDENGGKVHLVGYPRGFKGHQEVTNAEWRSLEIASEALQAAPPFISLYCHEIANTMPMFPGTPFDMWQGLSGGPCILLSSDETTDSEYVLGVVTAVGFEGIAGRVKCATMRAVNDLCIRSQLCFETVEPRMRIGLLENQAFGEMLRGLVVPSAEQHAWTHVSNLFFHHSGTVRELRSVTAAPSEYGVGKEDVPFVEYFIGRLLSKKGETNAADLHFKRAVIGSIRMDESAGKRLRTLVAMRQAAEQPLRGPLQKHLARLSAVRGSLEELSSIGDGYKSLELASLLGWQAMKIFLRADNLSADARVGLMTLANDHAKIVPGLRESRPNQEVVTTALRILASLWSGSLSELIEVERECSTGFTQARARHNSIFYTQMLLTRAIVEWKRGKALAANALALLVGETLVSLDLTSEHEGIAQLSAFARTDGAVLHQLISLPKQFPIGATPKEKLAAVSMLVGTSQESGEILARVSSWLADITS